MDENRMKISELERRSGVPRSRIYYYIKEGLLSPPEKTSRTMAYYDLVHLDRLVSIENVKMEYMRRNRKFKMPLSLLKSKLDEDVSIAPQTTREDATIDEPDYEYTSYRKDSIVEAALELFTNNGYYHTSMSDIARDVGISPSAIYLYFSNKRELFAAVIDNVIENLNRDVEQVLRTGTDPVDTYRSFFKVYEDYFPKLGEIIGQLRGGVVIRDEWAREKATKFYDDIVRTMKEAIRFVMDMGVLRELDIDLLAYYLISVMEASFQRSYIDVNHTGYEIRAFFFDVAYNGMAPRDS
jgi:AcrR family transcriptional regulator/DNA-binding transcriptional MerR regulator